MKLDGPPHFFSQARGAPSGEIMSCEGKESKKMCWEMSGMTEQTLYLYSAVTPKFVLKAQAVATLLSFCSDSSLPVSS